MSEDIDKYAAHLEEQVLELKPQLAKAKEQLRWRKCSEELPADTKAVLCRMKWSHSELTVTFTGYYARRWQIESHGDEECNAEYSEEKDQYFLREGWYENQWNWDDYGSIFASMGEVIEWQPITQGGEG